MKCLSVFFNTWISTPNADEKPEILLNLAGMMQSTDWLNLIQVEFLFFYGFERTKKDKAILAPSLFLIGQES
jgi:hypothetical protein